MAANATFVFTAPANPGVFVLKIKQDEFGSIAVSGWPATVKWPGGTAPTISAGGFAEDVIRFYFDGTNYYGTADLNFS